jgi:hypothetical protein
VLISLVLVFLRDAIHQIILLICQKAYPLAHTEETLNSPSCC